MVHCEVCNKDYLNIYQHNKTEKHTKNANLPAKQDTPAQNVVNNLVKNKTNQRQELAKLSEIAVHNDEPTFLRMIMGSTRIV